METEDDPLGPTADPDKFEKKVVWLMLKRYRKAYGASWEETEGVDSYDRFSALPYMFPVGGYKQTKKINLGALLNAFHKAEIAQHLKAFTDACRQVEDWLFVFSIPTSTALYAVVPGRKLSQDQCISMRFIVYKQFNNELVAIVRLDDYMGIQWPEEKEE